MNSVYNLFAQVQHRLAITCFYKLCRLRCAQEDLATPPYEKGDTGVGAVFKMVNYTTKTRLWQHTHTQCFKSMPFHATHIQARKMWVSIYLVLNPTYKVFLAYGCNGHACVRAWLSVKSVVHAHKKCAN